MFNPRKCNSSVCFLPVKTGDRVIVVIGRTKRMRFLLDIGDGPVGHRGISNSLDLPFQVADGPFSSRRLVNMRTRENLLSNLINAAHPLRVQSIIQKQIEEWSEFNLEKLIRYAPKHIVDQNLEPGSIRYPHLALEHLADRLSDAQLRRCILAAPGFAVVHAYKHMNRHEVWHACSECPDVVLKHIADKISLNQLRYAACYAPDIAYQIRHTLPGQGLAAILGYTIEGESCNLEEPQRESYADEIFDSIISHPEIWKETYGGDWKRLCLVIQMILMVDLRIDETNPPDLSPDLPQHGEENSVDQLNFMEAGECGF